MYRNFPVLDSEHTLMDAKRYNRARLALRRLGTPARLELTGIHDLELLIDEKFWICVDTGLGNLPVMAWKQFQAQGRQALHEPVPCRVDYYNLHAELIRDRVLDITDRLLAARLRRQIENHPCEIRRLPLRRRHHGRGTR